MTNSGLGGVPQSGGGTGGGVPRPEPTVMLPSMSPVSIGLGYSPMGMGMGMGYPPMGMGFGMPNMGMGGMPAGTYGFGHMGIMTQPSIVGMGGADNIVVPMFGNRLDLERERANHMVGHSALVGETRGQAIGAAVGVGLGIGGAALLGAKCGSLAGPWGIAAGAIIGGAIGLFAGGSIGSELSAHNAVMSDFRDNGRLDNSNHGGRIQFH